MLFEYFKLMYLDQVRIQNNQISIINITHTMLMILFVIRPAHINPISTRILSHTHKRFMCPYAILNLIIFKWKAVTNRDPN